MVLPLGSVGFATDLATQVRQFTHYEAAENVMYELSGAVRKCGGDSRINATAITGAPSLTGMFDFWRAGGAATFTQKFVTMTSDSKIYKEDMDGVFDDITGAATITANAIPVFCQARDLLIICDDRNDTPLKWNQTGNVASLAGIPPVARGMIFHHNRPWAWGVNANPSRLYYGSSTDAEDWSGADTGSIDIDPEDGDRIIGTTSYKKRLVIFKGPNKGSIHILSGTAPTGSDAFVRTPLTKGIPLQTHNSIIDVADDKWFMSHKGIHSLVATEQFGDFSGRFLTRFLHTFFREMNRSRLNQVWGVPYTDKSCALWVYPSSGNSTNNRTLGLSYLQLEEEGIKPFIWTRGGASAAIRLNPTSRLNQVVFGNTAGFALLEDQTSRSITPSTAYNMKLTTPRFLFAEMDSEGKIKPNNQGTLQRTSLRSVSTGNWNVAVKIQRDKVEGLSYNFNQGEDLTTTAGFILGTSRLGIDTLGGGSSTGGPQIKFADTPGEARTIQLEITQGGVNEDAQLYEAVVEWMPSAFSSA